jgi:hypothetical protein
MLLAWRFENIDWTATEAIGAWAGAVATAGAVFIAASFSRWAARRESVRVRKARYAALSSIYNEVAFLISELRDAALEGKSGIRASPPSLGQFDDLLAVLGSVPLLELGNANALYDLFRVKRALNGARDRLKEYGTPDWLDIQVKTWCDTWDRDAQQAAAAASQAASRGIWPHRNRAGDWVFPTGDEAVRERW